MKDGGRVLVKTTLTTNEDHQVDLGPDLKEWSPDSPFLYDLEISLQSGDTVGSYFGWRKIEMRKVGDFQRIFLNNKELRFQVGPLDQGYWPDGVLTPPTEEALKWDLQQIKEMGFNMVRWDIASQKFYSRLTQYVTVSLSFSKSITKLVLTVKEAHQDRELTLVLLD